MSDGGGLGQQQDRLKKAAVIIRRLEEKLSLLEQADQARSEPIAIVGIGCRFPGGASRPEAFWELVDQGRDAVRPLDERWALVGQQPGENLPRWAGLLTEDVTAFDAAFFGIAPREARSLDPQQRLLLEVAWEALEDAGISPRALDGSRTGVFVGAISTDYLHILGRQPSEHRDAYGTTGNLLSIAAGRVSYTFGVRGPCMTVDTACSSSLVAVHLACSSLRAGESDRALAGGVHLLLSPEAMEGLARTQALSPDGRCRTFDAAANGFVRGEGCGLVVLKRLRDAQRDGDRIWALIRGSAVNQDGRSTGLTAPNVLAQEALLREALASARIEAKDLGYVETHGTGTSLGDPIEVEALRAVVGPPRPDGARCVLGAVKTNLGHLEGAAGVAGLIKAALALRHERIPKNLNFRALNPRIRLDDSSLVLATEPVPWPRTDKPRFAGVSSFGFSGTNAHVVLEEAPAGEPAADPAKERPAELVVLSAKSSAALGEAAGRLSSHLSGHPELGLGEVAWTAATARSLMDHRLAVVASSREALATALRAASEGQTPPGAVQRAVATPRGKLAFLFTGQGAQVPGMGRALWGAWPVFREAFDRCVSLFERELEQPLRQVMWAEPGRAEASALDQTAYTQAALFTLEYALAALWGSWGVKPELVLGHSLGEIVAACVAGVLSLEDTVRLVGARGRLMQALPSGGAVVAIGAPEAEVAAAVAPHGAEVSIAAINGPAQVVISGAAGPVEAIAASFAARGVRTKSLPVSHAFHSPLIEPMLEAFGRVAASLTYQRPSLGLVSNLYGKLVTDEVTSPAYWVRHVREAVRFSDGVRALYQAGASTLIEVGPRPSLSSLVPACLPEANVVLLASLRASLEESVSVLEALGSLWAAGGAVDWTGVFAAGMRRVPLPTYPWQRKQHWVETPEEVAAPARGHAGGHPLLGHAQSVSTQPGMRLWETVIDGARLPWLREHKVQGAVVLPGAAYLEMALAVGADAFGQEPFVVADVTLPRALIFAREPRATVQVVTSEEPSGRLGFQIASLALGAERASWTVHARGSLKRVEQAAAAPTLDLAALRARLAPALPKATIYEALAAMGLEYGASFEGITELWKGQGEALGLVRRPQPLADATNYRMHPALMDACLQVMAGAFAATGDSTPWVPVEVGSLRLAKLPSDELWCHARVVRRLEQAPDRQSADLLIVDAQGEQVAEIRGLVVQRLSSASTQAPEGHLLDVAWERADLGAPKLTAGRWLLLGGGALGQALRAGLAAAGQAVAWAAGEVQSAADLRAVLADAFGGQPPTALVHLRSVEVGSGLDAEAIDAARSRGVDSVLWTVQALAAMAYRDAPRLWLVTRGAQAVGAGEVSVAQAPLLGLGRTVALEHRELRCCLMDLDPAVTAGEVEALQAELLADDAEEEVALRADGRRVARLLRSSLEDEPRARAGDAPSSPKPVGPRSEGSYVVTGGLGGLGLRAARWLVEQGAGHVVLLGRSGATTEAQRAAVATLEAEGARVTVVRADVASRSELMRAFEAVNASGKPLRGIIHAAGTLDDGLLLQQDAGRMRAVLAPKVLGALYLHELTREAQLDFFVLYASIAGLMGSPGQGSYAAANTFLDALAHRRRALGLPALSIDWGAFAEVGLAAAQDNRGARLALHGMRSMSPDEGIAQLARLLESDRAQVGVASLDMRQWVASHPAAASSRRLSRLVSGPRATASAGAGDKDLLKRLEKANSAARAVLLQEMLRAQLSQILRLPGDKIDADAPLTDLGMDSLMGLELRSRIDTALAITVPATLLWTYPTLAAIERWLLEEALPFAQGPMQASGTDEPRADVRAMVHALRFRPIAAPRARLFCFHGAGGSPDLFGPLVERVPADIEVVGMWHDRHRAGEAPPARKYLDDVVALFRHYADAPFALFGYSLGGVYAWRVAAELAVSPGAPAPAAIFPCGSSLRLMGYFSEEEKDDLLSRLYGMQVQGYRRALAQVRADLSVDLELIQAMGEVLDRSGGSELRKLPCPIIAVGGASDPLVPFSELEGWKALTTAQSHVHTLPGDHLFMAAADNDVQIVQIVNAHLEALLPER